ncbi:MAG: hypothetical protein JWO69_1169 [Thermoleophilia bacterium]|nr:hypothetical protein [Thermoleophilia bacterium]
MTTYRTARSSLPVEATNGAGERDALVARLANRQHALGTREQLRALGMTWSAIRWRLTHGRYFDCGHGVYAIGHKPTSLAARRMAAVLSVGDGAALARRSAAHSHDLVPFAPPRIDVVVARRHRGVAGIDVHFARNLPESDVVARDGIPVTSVTRTILDLGSEMTPIELAQVMHQAARRRRLNIRALQRALRSGQGRPGMLVVQRALILYQSGSVGARSKLELRFDASLTRAGVTGRRLNIEVAVRGELLEVDQVYASNRLCVEVDGPDHDLPAVRREDARRDRLLRAAGWRVVRVSYAEIEGHVDEAIERVRRALGEK